MTAVEMTGDLLDVQVHGTPAPQGSKRHVGGGRMVESSARVQPWREAVKAAILLSNHGPLLPVSGPVAVTILFSLQRPSSHYGAGRNRDVVRPSAPVHPTTKPDIDKLIRSTLDALGEVGTYRDDSQVVTLTTQKLYARRTESVGAHIRVREVS